MKLRNRIVGLVGLLLAFVSLEAIGCEIEEVSDDNLVDFGIISAANKDAVTGTAQINVVCNPVDLQATTMVTLTISEGSSGTFATRRFLSGGANIEYNLYEDPFFQSILGDGSAGSGTTAITNVCITSAPCVFDLYGRIDANQTFFAGNFTDDVIIQLEF